MMNVREFIRVTTWLVVLCTSSGCTPIRHRLEPYREDSAAAGVLEQRAITICRQQVGAGMQLPSQTFTTDGCSFWPNGSWVECCVEHDMHYWCGGTMADRTAADADLQRCVAEKTNAAFAVMMYLGVRAGGAECLPFPWRWGYGWNWLEAP